MLLNPHYGNKMLALSKALLNIPFFNKSYYRQLQFIKKTIWEATLYQIILSSTYKQYTVTFLQSILTYIAKKTELSYNFLLMKLMLYCIEQKHLKNHILTHSTYILYENIFTQPLSKHIHTSIQKRYENQYSSKYIVQIIQSLNPSLLIFFNHINQLWKNVLNPSQALSQQNMLLIEQLTVLFIIKNNTCLHAYIRYLIKKILKYTTKIIYKKCISLFQKPIINLPITINKAIEDLFSNNSEYEQKNFIDNLDTKKKY